MIELYIIRHGRTVWNAAGKIQGSADIELTEDGREGARITGKVWENENLHFDAVYSSPLKRAFETAQIVSAYTGLSVQADARLREMGFGVLEGAEVFHITDSEADPLHGCFFDHPECYVTPENGESFEELGMRAKSFLDELFEKYTNNERILIVAHGAMNKALMRVMKKSPLEEFWAGKLQKNCGVNIVRTDGKCCEVIAEGKLFTL